MSTLKPLVIKKGGKQRFGKGFSMGELKAAKLSLKKALKLGVSVDPRRRTVHDENVKALNEFLAEAAKTAAKEPPKSKAKTRKPKSEKKQ
ncbi:MAG: ribosomal protein L13e [Candidatus Bathyarchaeia archaeon]